MFVSKIRLGGALKTTISSWLKVGTLVASFVLLAGCVDSGAPREISSSPEIQTTSDPTPIAPEVEPGEPVEIGQVVGLNEVGADGPFQFRVNVVDCGQKEVGYSSANMVARGQFCFVELEVKNFGSYPAFFEPNFQMLVTDSWARNVHDSLAESYCYGLEASGLVNTGTWSGITGTSCYKTFSGGTLNPGISTTGTLIFDFDPLSKATALELHAEQNTIGLTVQLN
jgi:hypothetical protein